MQRLKISAVETVLNISTGALIAYAMTLWFLPLWGYHPTPGTAFEITALYTATSFIRSFLFRRGFNYLTNREKS